MTTKVVNLAQLHSLQDHTMICAAIVFLVAIVIALLVSNIIKYQGGKDKSYIKRRIWFILVGIVSCISFYLYNDLVVKSSIVNAGFKSMFVETNIICLGIIAAGYFVLGIVLMFIFRNSKFGSILGKGRE